MKKKKRAAAFLLSLMMAFPAQGMTAFGDTGAAAGTDVWVGAETFVESEIQAEAPEIESEEPKAPEMESAEPEEITSAQETVAGTLESPETAEQEFISEESPSEQETALEESFSEQETISEESPSEQETALEENPSEPETSASGRVEETLPLEPLEPETGAQGGAAGSQGGDRIEALLPLEPVKEEISMEGLSEIYWNPGSHIPEEMKAAAMATLSNAASDEDEASRGGEVSDTGQSAPKGSDGANGFTPEHPVKSLKKALKQAEKLAERNHLDLSDITIYAMNPMEVADGTMYVLNAGGARIVSWPERGYYNDTIFYINGGRLALVNAVLEAGGGAAEPEEAQLVQVYGGALQLGQNARIDGRIVMDYRKDRDNQEKGGATASDAETESSRHEESVSVNDFDLNNYLLNTAGTEWDLLEDRSGGSTWREPVIELAEGFDGVEDSYLLELRRDRDDGTITLAETLYADGTEAETFAEFFRLADTAADEWTLVSHSRETATVRNTGASLLSSSAATVKTLTAVPLSTGGLTYWNPGGPINVNGIDYPAGSDEATAGKGPEGAFKTLEKAVSAAGGGTVICMQTVTLGSDAGQYLWGGPDTDGILWAKSSSYGTRVTIEPWEFNLQPIFRVPEGEILGLENITLGGGAKEGGSQAVVCEGGDLVINGGVTAESGYLQINGSTEPGKDLKDHPVKVRNADNCGKITLLFGGINDNLSYRYTDVVVPDGALQTEAETGLDSAEAIGEKLRGIFGLNQFNKSTNKGGSSQYNWELRQDTMDDDGAASPQNLELYVDYYFNAVYVNGKDGDDGNYGSNCRYPVKTFEKAKKILEDEAARSVEKRKTAHDSGMSEKEINEEYPLPAIIYVCDTLEVGQAKTWTLDKITDYDGTVVTPELVSHTEIPQKEDGTPLHNLTKAMIKVGPTGSLTLEDLVIRSLTDESDSVTVRVEDGGKLTVKGNTRLTGAQSAWEQEEAGITDPEVLKTNYRRVTSGTHVWVEDGGAFDMPADWTGSIERRGRGLCAEGSRAKVTMYGGVIRRNNGRDMIDMVHVKNNPIKGAGIYLWDGASMIIDGGTISENITYQYGGGIGLEGAGTNLKLISGEISANQSAKYTSSNSVLRKLGIGIGIYASNDTILEIGTPSGSPEAVLIKDNEAFQANGVGIWSSGTLKMYHTTISGNTSDPYPDDSTNDSSDTGYRYPSQGIGLYVSNYGSLYMEDCDVRENGAHAKAPGSKYAVAHGAGIYLHPGSKDKQIVNCRINGNYSGEGRILSGYEYVGHGGGIFVGYPDSLYGNQNANGKLEITGCEISDNRSGYGAGVFLNGDQSSSSKPKLMISGTAITGNQASGSSAYIDSYGRGGGICVAQYASAILNNGSKVSGNKANKGGGIFAIGSNAKLYLDGTAGKPAIVSGNEATGLGGGIYASDTAMIYARYAKINDNSGSGFYSYNCGGILFRDVDIMRNTGAAQGGGIYYSGRYTNNSAYLTNVKIEGNTAAQEGGGIYMDSSVYFTETTPGESTLKGNTAPLGGGLYCRSGGGSILNLEEMSNTASVQGSNIYQVGGPLTLIKGELKRTPETGDDVYNIYINYQGGGTSTMILDPREVTVDKKSEADPKAVYLNTAQAYLSYLTEPTGAAHTLPIDLNTEKFSVGSVVIKPAYLDKVNPYRLSDTDAVNITTENDFHNYTKLESVAGNLDYSRGGILPRKTRIGAYQDPVNSDRTNAVLVGEGVYLASYGDDDKDGAGDTPDNPVKTFTKAKTLLEKYITEAAADANDSDGFAPYIYICGNVKIDDDENWELDHTSAPFDKAGNIKFWDDEQAVKGSSFNEEDCQTQVRRFASFVNKPMITVGEDASKTVEFTLDKIILDGMVYSVVTSDQGALSPVIKGTTKAKVTLKGNAAVRNNYYYGINMSGGELILTGGENDQNRQISNILGSGVNLVDGAHGEMQGRARILPGYSTGSTYIGIEANQNSSVLMKDHSIIEGGSIGIQIYNPDIIEMEDFAEIHSYEGIRVAYGSTRNKIYMNMGPDAEETDSARITKGNETTRTNMGIRIEGGENLDIRMGKQAKICDLSGDGIAIYGMKNGSILMQDNSAIEGNNGGITLIRTSDNFTIHMKDSAVIAGNLGKGIDGYNYQYFNGFNLWMEDTARIGGNRGDGVNIGYVSADAMGFDRKIILKDDAVIGGEGKWADGKPETGNSGSGLTLSSGIDVTMEGNALVKDNKEYGLYLLYPTNVVIRENASVEKNGRNGIYLNADKAGPMGKLLLADNSKITGNDSFSIQSSSAVNNRWNIILQDQVSIRENKLYMASGKSDNLYLKDNAWIDAPIADVRSISCAGKLYLDGTAVVEGDISLWNYPITMTKKTADPDRIYRLQLQQGFMGNIVVQPDDPDGAFGGVTDLNQDPKQLAHFIKVPHNKEGLIADKILLEDGKNIVLQGNNDVYLSGRGNDANNGMTPDTPVRTFKQAKYLLENGRYSRGANIIICNEVVVGSDDTDWSFGPDGTVINAKTKDTWKPLVIRWKEYTGGSLIRANSYTKMEFTNITIDGGAESGIICSTKDRASLLILSNGSNVTLGPGAVLQNNKIDSIQSGDASAVYIDGGTLVIDGGTIRNNSIERRFITGSNYINPTAVVYCKNYSSYALGRIIMKSGSITGNRVESDHGQASVFTVTGTNCAWEMSGGTISENTLQPKRKNTEVIPGSVLLVLDGNASMTGGAIRNNKGDYGSAIYYNGDGEMVLSGGQIQNNSSIGENGTEIQAVGEHSAIYVAGSNFQLKGGGSVITDKFYLDSIKHVIKVSGNIYQSNRRYDVFVDTQPNADGTYFKKGSVVVAPDGVWMSDVTSYLSNFQVMSRPYVLDRGQSTRGIDPDITAGTKEQQCLLLMQAVFLDSVNGDDTNDGITPEKAAASFTRAKELGENGEGGTDMQNYYIIYISGRAINTAAEDVWSAASPAYVCRYTGFDLYDENGLKIPSEKTPAYYGSLIEPDAGIHAELTLKDINIYGRRSIDTTDQIGESLVMVNPGVSVKLEQGTGENTVIGRNWNLGSFSDPQQNRTMTPLSSKGGAVHVRPGGAFHMSGGTIMDVEATYGSAVYAGADSVDPSLLGTIYLTGNPSIEGKIFLEGESTVTAAYVKADQNFRPKTPVEVEVRNDYHSRIMIDYVDGITPGLEELEQWQFQDSLLALYEITNRRAPNDRILELYQRTPIYLDGKNGSDSNDGTTPADAFKTLKKVYQYIQNKTADEGDLKGMVVFVVDSVELSENTAQHVELNNIMIREDNGTVSYEGSYKDDDTPEIPIRGQVYFKRYSQPTGYNSAQDEPGEIYEGFGKETYKGSLFTVNNGGDLTLSGIYLDGHSNASIGNDVRLTADAVKAEAPLITVTNGGAVSCKPKSKQGIPNGIDTATVLTNNINVNQKTKSLGFLHEGTPDEFQVMEGSAAGIELLDLKTADTTALPLARAELSGAEFRNLALGSDVVSGGSDVYSNGELRISDWVLFEGSVFLEGLGSAENPASHSTSRFIYADTYAFPAKNTFRVEVRDPYASRTVVEYQKIDERIPGNSEKALYLLDEQVRDWFYLNNRESYPQILELQLPVSVYIDGIGGHDIDPSDPNYRNAGATPNNPVKTLGCAFSLLNVRGSGTIFVVNHPIQVNGNVTMTGTSFKDETTEVKLNSTDKIRILRYMQPDFAKDGYVGDTTGKENYQVADYTGALLNVGNNSIAGFSDGVIFDGHSEQRKERNDPKEVITSTGMEADAPLITVETGGRLELGSGVVLQNNHNTGSGAGHIDGGAIQNSGTTEVTGVVFENTAADKGAAVYQDGTFTILGDASEPGLVFNGDGYKTNQFYLTTVNSGTEAAPVWGEDHVISVGYRIPDDRTGDKAYQVDMDHAVSGRDVVRFIDPSAYESDPAITGCDPEHEHFRLGSTVFSELFLVQAKEDETVLELQDWKILNVEVPQDIYLVLSKKAFSNSPANLSGIQIGTPELFSTPKYEITNQGRYDVSVELSGIDNLNAAAGIGSPAMDLAASPAAAAGNKDLYLAIKGSDGMGTGGFDLEETALTDTMTEAHMGTLKAGTAGNTGTFEFTAAVGEGFMDNSDYKDLRFPLTDQPEDVQKYMDGSTAAHEIHACAKYLLKFKVSMVPSR